MAALLEKATGDGIASNVTSGTLTVNVIATPGNLLICSANVARDSTFPAPITPDTGWNEYQSVGLTNSFWYSSILWRIADGTALDDYTVSWAGGASRPMAFIAEFSGLDGVSPLEDDSFQLDETQGNELSSGTATPLTPNGTHVAVLALASSVRWDLDSNLQNITDSLGLLFDINNPGYSSLGGTYRSGAKIGHLPYSSIVGRSNTYTSSREAGGSEAYSAIFALKEPGGPPVVPEEVSFTKINAALATSGQVNLDRADVRALAGVPSGEIAFSDFFGKLTP